MIAHVELHSFSQTHVRPPDKNIMDMSLCIYRYTVDIGQMVSVHGHRVSLSELCPVFAPAASCQRSPGRAPPVPCCTAGKRWLPDAFPRIPRWWGCSGRAKGSVAVSGTVAAGQRGHSKLEAQNHQTKIEKHVTWLEVMAWIVGEKLNYSCHIPTDQNAHRSVRAQWDMHSPAGEPRTSTPARTAARCNLGLQFLPFLIRVQGLTPVIRQGRLPPFLQGFT